MRAVSTINPAVAALAHATRQINAFLLDNGAVWTLESASRHGLVRLLDRLLRFEWPGFTRECREKRLYQTIQDAIKHGYDEPVLEWWIKRYMPDQTVVSWAFVLELAVKHERIPVLELLHQETQGKLPMLDDPVPCFDVKVVIWLHEHGHGHLCAKLSLINCLTSASTFQSIQQCLIYEDQDSSFRIDHAERAVYKAFESGDVDHLLWLYDNRLELLSQKQNLNLALRYGGLKAAKWLDERFPSQHFDYPRRTFTKVFYDQEGYAIEDKIFLDKYNLDLVQWVVCEFSWSDDIRRLTWIDDAMEFAARTNQLEILEFAYALLDKLPGSTFSAYRIQRPTLYNWLEPNLEVTRPLCEEVYEKRVFSSSIMDTTASNGHLSILEWLQARPRQECTTNAMDVAAANGHLEVVQWLHQNRCEGCTYEAMNEAAGGGYLEIIQWLHEHTTQGCTVKAIEVASRNGHFEVAKWLHRNKYESCRQGDLSSAAENGHLDVVKFLYTNGYQPRDILPAKMSAASNGHFEVFVWLPDITCSLFSLGVKIWKRKGRESHICLLKCEMMCTTHDRWGWFVDQFVELGDFKAAELALTEARAVGVASLTSRFVDF